MKPVEFDEVNVTIAKNQPQYLNLPSHVTDRDGDVTDPVVTCWEMTEEERGEFEKTGKIWLTLLTFGNDLQPIRMQAISPFKEEAGCYHVEKCSCQFPEVRK